MSNTVIIPGPAVPYPPDADHRPRQAGLLRLAILGAATVLVTAVGPWLHMTYGPMAFWAVIVATTGIAALAALTSDRLPVREALIVIAIVAIAMRLPQLLMTPYLSDDIYRYVWDGRVQAAGINPFRYIPQAPELQHLRDKDIFPLINRADYAVTIYPPVAQAYFLAITWLGETVLVMKLGLVAFELAAIAATLAVLRRLDLPPTRIAAFAWHPLAVWEIAGSGHLDAGLIGLMLPAVAAFLGGRKYLGGILAAAAALMKPTALVMLPAFWRPWDWRLPAVVVATLVICYVPYLSVGSGVFGFLYGYAKEEDLTHGQGFRYLLLVEAVTGPLSHGALGYALVAAAILGTMALAIGFTPKLTDTQRVTGAAALLTTFLILLTPHYPWYYLALVPFLTIYPTSATLWLLSIGGMQTYHKVEGYFPASYDVRQMIFHSSVLVALAFDLRSPSIRRALAAAISPRPFTRDPAFVEAR